MSAEVAVYTAIIGGTDALKEPLFPSDDYDCICFTDEPSGVQSNIFQVVPLYDSAYDPGRLSRKVKLNPHNYLAHKYRYSLWVDASILIALPSIKEFIQNHIEQSKFWTFQHHRRTSVREEVDYCIRQNRDSVPIILTQYNRYIEEGFPDNQGLVENGVLLRETFDPDVVRFNEAWWHEVITGSRRDQLSFNYVAWKQRLQYLLFNVHGGISGTIDNNPIFQLHKHLRSYPPPQSTPYQLEAI